MVVTISRMTRLPKPGKSWTLLVGHSRRLRVDVGDRLYVVHDGKLWGYGQVALITSRGKSASVLGCGAPRRTILPCKIRSFKGHRYRWWDRTAEKDADA